MADASPIDKEVLLDATPEEVFAYLTDGWQHYLARLEVRVAGRAPGPDALADPELRHG